MRTLMAATAAATAGLCVSAKAQWSTNGSNIFFNTGNVGIGTANPVSRVHAVTNVAMNGTRAAFGHASAATGVTYGVYGLANSTSARGVFGWANAASGTTFGVMGQATSTTGRGVLGLATATAGNAWGVMGQSNSTSGRGVFGLSTATTGLAFGVFGEAATMTNTTVATPANTPAGVFGRATNTVGRTAGVLGHAASPKGAGVAGFETATTGASAGVYGEAHSPSGSGVSGFAAASSGSATGVFGTTDSAAQGWGVFADGALGASGEKLFQIDHPLDPANKYLNHFCAEGPEPLLIYRGNATLDEHGSTWVELPAYFEALNRDFHYQLTPIGAPALLYVAREIESNRFMIAGGQPGMKVSWTVTGARNDLYVRAYGKQVEQEKTAEERGRYIRPELYGQPPEAAIRRVPGR